VLAPADVTAIGRTLPELDAVNDLGRLMHRQLSRLPRGRPRMEAVPGDRQATRGPAPKETPYTVAKPR
jgi:hypothetical protein